MLSSLSGIIKLAGIISTITQLSCHWVNFKLLTWTIWAACLIFPPRAQLNMLAPQQTIAWEKWKISEVIIQDTRALSSVFATSPLYFDCL